MDRMMPEYQFPELYHESCLVLLVRDPHCIYAYWELSPEIRKNLKEQFEGNREQHLHLRVFDSTGLEDKTENLHKFSEGSHSFCDFTLHPMADNYFIKDLEANRSYRVELGVILEDGDFLTLLRSKAVHTPRNSIAEKSPLAAKEVFLGKEAKDQDLLIGSFASKGIYGESMG